MACCFRVFCVTAFVTRGIQLLISQHLFWKFFWNWVLKQRHITSLQRLSCLYFELSKDQERGYNHLPAAVMWGHSCQAGLLKWWHRRWFFVGFYHFISLTSLTPNNWWVRHLKRCGCWSQSSTGLGVFSREQILFKSHSVLTPALFPLLLPSSNSRVISDWGKGLATLQQCLSMQQGKVSWQPWTLKERSEVSLRL